VLDYRSLTVYLGFLFALAVLGSSACASVRVHAQSMCLPDTADYSLTQRDWVVEVVTGTDTLSARMRNAYNLPAVTALDVIIVTDPTACSQAAQVMAAQYNRQQYPVMLIRAGAQRYVVHDGQPLAPGGYLPTLVLDQHFAVLEKLVARP
jgi:hypothetical protein